MRRTWRRVSVAVCLASLPAVAAAAPLPAPAELTSSEREAVVRAVEAQRSASDPGALLATLDGLLATQAQPNRGRGMIQMMRAPLLSTLKRDSEAGSAAREAIRLLPDYSAPLMVGAEIFTFSTMPGEAADYVVRASRIDPDMVAQMPSYDVNNLRSRLKLIADERRSDQLTDRLIEIGWSGDRLDSRSTIVADAIRNRLRKKDLAGARALVPDLLDPSDHYTLLSSNVSQDIWPDLTAWAGAKLEKQWPVYLREARRRYRASNDLLAGRDYLAALLTADRPNEAITELLPVFTSPDLTQGDDDALFAAAPLASALASLGRFDEAEAVYTRLEKIWPLGSTTNALNLYFNHAALLINQGKVNAGLAILNPATDAAIKAGSEVNLDAIAIAYQNQACAFHQQGRSAEAEVAARKGLQAASFIPTGVVGMYLCLQQPDKAKAFVLDRLKDQRTNDRLFAELQPPSGRPWPTAVDKRQYEGWQALRKDPDVRRAASARGRLLTFALNAGVPEALPD